MQSPAFNLQGQLRNTANVIKVLIAILSLPGMQQNRTAASYYCRHILTYCTAYVRGGSDLEKHASSLIRLHEVWRDLPNWVDERTSRLYDSTTLLVIVDIGIRDQLNIRRTGSPECN